MRYVRNNAIVFIAACSVCVYVLIPGIEQLGRYFAYYLLLFTPAFLLYLAAWYAVRNDRSARTGWIITGCAVISYLLLIPTAPGLSDDVYRYLWEGKVQRLGFNPFSVAPDDSALNAYRDGIWNLVTFRHMGTIYPPFAQLWFRISGAVHYSLWFFKLSLLPFFLLAIYGVRALLKVHGKNPNQAVLFALNPLVIIETSSSGHLDIIGTSLMILALLLHYRKRDMAGAAVLAGAVCVKFIPIIAFPFIFLRTGRKWWYTTVFTAVILMLYVPFMSAGSQLFGSLGTYTEHWYFNASVFRLYALAGGPRNVYTAAAALLLLATAGFLAYRRIPVERSVAILLGCIYLLSPVLFPWYLLWILPFAALFRIWPVLVFSGIIQISYAVNWKYRLSGVWSEPWYIAALQYGLLVVMVVAWYAFKRKTVQPGMTGLHAG